MQRHNRRQNYSLHIRKLSPKNELSSASLSVSVSVLAWLQKAFCDHPKWLDGGERPFVTIHHRVRMITKVYIHQPTRYYKHLHGVWMVTKGLLRSFYVLTDVETDADHKRFRIHNESRAISLLTFAMYVKHSLR